VVMSASNTDWAEPINTPFSSRALTGPPLRVRVQPGSVRRAEAPTRPAGE
jgi:hypothetical protein